MVLSIIVAAAENNVIGRDNGLEWRLSGDLKHFKALTTGHTILMGRKTYESVGRALPNRRNIVISRNADYKAEGCEVVQMCIRDRLYPEYYILRVNDFNKWSKVPLEQWIYFLNTGEIPDDATAPGLPEARERLKLDRLDKDELKMCIKDRSRVLAS